MTAHHLAEDLVNVQAAILKPGMTTALLVEEEQQRMAIEPREVSTDLERWPQAIMVGMKGQAIMVWTALAVVKEEVEV